MSRFLGIDIGGTKCAVCVGDDNAQVLGRRELLTSRQPEETLGALEGFARELLR